MSSLLIGNQMNYTLTPKYKAWDKNYAQFSPQMMVHNSLETKAK